jgi:hypothetical protein
MLIDIARLRLCHRERIGKKKLPNVIFFRKPGEPGGVD